MQGEVIVLPTVGSCADNVRTIAEEVGAKGLNEGIDVGFVFTGGDLRVEFARNGLPGIGFESGDHLRGLTGVSRVREGVREQRHTLKYMCSSLLMTILLA